MKKLLAVLLTLTMLVTLLAFGASADNVVGGDDGVLTFDPTTTNPEQNLNVKVSDITHKYAVDITFTLNDLEIGGSITWNVKDLKYDVVGGLTGVQKRNITVSNRSDLPVYAYATISNTDNADGITVTAEKDSATNKLTIAKATAGAGANNGTSTVEELVINLKSTNWNAVAEYYAAQRLASANQETDTFRIATVTVTISKN